MSLVSPQISFNPPPPPPVASDNANASGFVGERRLSVVAARLAFVECLMQAAAGYAVTVFYFDVALQGSSIPSRYLLTLLAIALIELVIVLVYGQHSKPHDRAGELGFWAGPAAAVAAFCLVLSTLYLLQLGQDMSRFVLLLQLLAISITVAVMRAVHRTRLWAKLRSGEIDSRRVILVGEKDQCVLAAWRLRAAGVSTLRSFPFPPAASADPWERKSVVAEIIRECRQVAADDVIILSDEPSLDSTAEVARQFSELPMNVRVLPTALLDVMPRGRIVRCGDLLALGIYDRPLTTIDCAVKRAFDVVAAATWLMLLMPLLAIVAIAIKLDTRGPIIFAQRRHGYNNIPFRMFKFRTMTVLEDGNDFRQATRHDSRVTRVGRFLRRSSIDELPQLYNVLIGDMSIVGPRPHAVAHNEMFDGVIASLWRRHNVKPGITGWAQANGYRGETNTPDLMRQRIEHDLYYIERWSFWLDIKIILMTLFCRASYVNAH